MGLSRKAELTRERYLSRIADENRLHHLKTKSDYSTPSRDYESLSGKFQNCLLLRG